MEEFLTNPGLCHIVRNISSFLDPKSLAQCRRVCHSWKDLIDNDRPWLVFQLQHIHGKEKTFGAEGKPKVKDTIAKRFPEWSAFIQKVSRKQNIQRLKETVRHMWPYFNDETMAYTKVQTIQERIVPNRNFQHIEFLRRSTVGRAHSSAT